MSQKTFLEMTDLERSRYSAQQYAIAVEEAAPLIPATFTTGQAAIHLTPDQVAAIEREKATGGYITDILKRR